MTVATPDRSLDQRMAALRRANRIRSARATLKSDLKTGNADICALLANPPSWLLTARVYDLLLATPKIGRVKANRILIRARISPSKTVGGLSDRQRDELLRVFRERVA